MKNLALDFGNTNIKFGLFEKDVLRRTGLLENTEALKKLIAEEKPENIAMASVSAAGKEVLNEITVSGKILELTHQTKLPITNLYETPETLGKDRLAAVLGAFYLFPKTNCLIIDAGTCITYDFLDAEGNYHGGSISPGIQMKFRALHTFTQRLPLVEGETTLPELTGKNTLAAIKSGVLQGTLAEAQGIQEQYAKRAKSLVTVVCGGDAGFFESNLKGCIFAVPELVLIGLNTIILDHA